MPDEEVLKWAVNEGMVVITTDNDFKDKISGETISEKAGFQKAAQVWHYLPVPLTKIIGPTIRKYINL